MIFDTEMATYQRNLPALLQHEGRYALIYGEEVLGVFDTLEMTLAFGYEQVGLYTAFLAKKIGEKERVHAVMRGIPVHTPEPVEWLDKPTGEGMWWVVDPETPDKVDVAHVYFDTRWLVRCIGPAARGNYPFASFILKGLKWCKATPPTYTG